jgi:hypothetical protein
LLQSYGRSVPRLTITVPDDLYADVEAEAAGTGRTLSELFTDACRVMILRREAARRSGPAELPTYGAGGLQRGVDLDNNAALRDYFDEIGEKCWP